MCQQQRDVALGVPVDAPYGAKSVGCRRDASESRSSQLLGSIGTEITPWPAVSGLDDRR
jgi:hypothetical protein